MAVITINPLEILDGDDVTVIDLEALTDPAIDPHKVLDALEVIQPLSARATSRVLDLADHHPEITYTVVNENDAPTERAFPRRLEFISAYRGTSLESAGVPAVGVDGRYLVLRASAMSTPLAQMPF